MSFYNTLLSETEEDRLYLLRAPIIEDVFAGRFGLGTYLAFLHQAYHHVRHTAPLLEAARSRLSERQQWVFAALTEYIAEEAGHEAWILNDIAACGENAETWAERPPGFATEMMVAFLYDFIARQNPMGIFGMVLVLEGTSSNLAPTVANIVQGHLNLPGEAMSYLVTHGELDQEHMNHFEAIMDRVTAKEDQEAIVHVARRVYRLYGDVYRALPSGTDVLAEAA
ncbi:MAG: iron-containing redox enzyme family protein [Halieaceae bacterium]|jgi:pyrroloquinoline quinone (PQQ) biosynthesis protein C|nr:iron-containing redox enzyme family protein [Halieaceae bacterium]